jgi:hypothetical protein
MPLSTATAKSADMYGTHLPVLRALPRVASILEAGAGWHSTPVLAAMCDRLESYDDSPHWCLALTRAAAGAYVVQHAAPSMPETIQRALALHVPDLCMIDCGTCGIAKTADRGRIAVMALTAGVRFVVCHDTEPPVLNVYDWSEAFAMATHRLDWPGAWYGARQPDGRLAAWTTVLSMVDDLAGLRRNLRMPA